MLKVGYIGLGIMGKPIASNILRAGFPLIVFNRSQAAVVELVAAGAEKAVSPQEVAQWADVVFTNLPDSPEVEEVLLGKNGVVKSSHKGLICVDNSTIKPASARKIFGELAKVGINFLDAPVSGGDIGARNGTLTIMIGGNQSALEKVLPVLMAIGKTITHVGGPGDGQVAKAANQIMVAAQMVAMGELLLLAKNAGADPKKVVEAIRAGAAQCWALDHKPERLFANNRNPGFKSVMQLKDLRIVMDTAREYGVNLPLTSVTTALYDEMVSDGLGQLDNSAIIAMLEKESGKLMQK